ncbi:ATP12 family chaperone protein [Falsirhodobacter sp. 20TX0035]|uniref:ATP12 family chaperone protein n=1 Tax=Falsirhodobacter sp. 20TX0035 TaxID=3022019 RepID=UPI00232ED97E|nr:ATP12 family protein [Falsirhodobacter sp. 20TX0035]MDB6454660.1 ATPase [Falsirhodobacter sp. 20TX0035]
MSWAPKRFWSDVTVRPEGAGFAVLLDGRPVRTPAKTPLILPSEALAREIAAEWQAQEREVRPDLMPATRRANSAFDKVTPQFDAVVGEVAKYGATDLLCYRAEGPAELVRRQQVWDEVLRWAATRLHAPLIVTAGVIPCAQPPESLQRLREQVAGCTPFQLVALHDLVAMSGSLLLGLAVAHGHLTGAEAFALSRLDETFQAEVWGHDEDAAEATELRLKSFLEAERFFYCVGDNLAQ